MRKLFMLLLLATVFVIVGSGVAYAQDGSIGPTQPGVSDLGWVMFTATLVPLAVAIVTKWNTSSVIKSMLMAFLSVVTSSIVVWQTWPDGTELTEFAFAGLTAIVTSAATYYGVWKPTTIAPKLQDATTPSASRQAA